MSEIDLQRRAQTLLEEGAGLYDQGKLYEALSCWKQVLQIDPGNEIATEYLRFIEDRFQIGVDAFIEHHGREPEVLTSPVPAVAPESLKPGTLDAADAGGMSYEELDWSEILEDGGSAGAVKSAAGPAVPPLFDLGHGDEDFFGELNEDSPLGRGDPEIIPWGEADEGMDSGILMPVPASGADAQPELDPLGLPVSHFASPFRQPLSGELPSADGEQRSSPGGRRHGSVERESRRPGAANPYGTLDEAPSTPSVLERRARRALGETGPPSFSGKVPSSGVRRGRQQSPSPSGGAALDPDELDGSVSGSSRGSLSDDVDDLEILLEKGVGEVRRGRARSTGSRRSSQSPGRSTPPGAVGQVALGEEIEAVLRSGIEAIDRIDQHNSRQASGLLPPPIAHRPTPVPTRTSTGGASQPRSDPDLVTTGPPGASGDALMAQARRRQAADDFTGSMLLVEQVLASDPQQAEALRYLAENTSSLLAMYRSRLGRLTHCPAIRLRPQDIIWQSFDHRAGFLLSQVDGQTSYEDIVDISGMPELEATRLLAGLVEQGVIGVIA